MTFVQQLFKVVENDRTYIVEWDFPGSSDGKESICNAGELGSIPGLGRSPGERNGDLLLGILAWRISIDGGAWRATATDSQKVRHDQSNLAHMLWNNK